jgi:hypothetical protein
VLEEYNIKLIAEKIETIKRTATELKNISGGIQAIDRNVDRILASVKMMEINITDVADIIAEEPVD